MFKNIIKYIKLLLNINKIYAESFNLKCSQQKT